MAACIHALASFYEIVSIVTFFMREQEAQDAFQQIRTCSQHYIWLQLAINDSIRWQVTGHTKNSFHEPFSKPLGLSKSKDLLDIL